MPRRSAAAVLFLAWAACTRAPPSDTGASSSSDTDSGSTAPPSFTFTAVGYNVESGGADPYAMADEVVAAIAGETLFGFAEVEDDRAAAALVDAADDGGQDFRYVLGTTGYEDRLVLAWDDATWALESSEELDDINVGGTARAPLVGRMRHRATGTPLVFVVNHLWRTDTAARHEQAELLNDWGDEQTSPVLMVGDFNFDWDVESGEHDEGYDSLTAGGTFEWVRPAELIRTQCSGYYDSVLDFSFVGGDARAWTGSAEVLRSDPDYCRADPYVYADHRPVAVTLTTP